MPTPKKESASTKANSVGTTSKKKQQLQSSNTKIKVNESSPRFFSGDQWIEVFDKSLQCWRYIIGRYLLVLALILVLQFLGVALLSGALLVVLGGIGGLENVVANIQVGTLPTMGLMGASTGVFLVWLVCAITIAVMAKLTLLGLINDYVNQQKRGVITLFFKVGFAFLLRYLGLGVKILFYIFWPLLVVFGLFVAWDLVLFFFPNTLILKASYVPYAFGISFFTALFYVIYMMIRLLFTMPALIHSQKSVGEIYALSKSITNGAWWYTLFMWGLFVVLLYAINTGLALVGAFDPIILVEAVRPEDGISLTDLLAFLLSLFIFGPISTAFQYLLMLQVAQNQSVKL